VDALAGSDGGAEWQAFALALEELRVATYAQELGTKGGVSAKKLATRLAALRR